MKKASANPNGNVIYRSVERMKRIDKCWHLGKLQVAIADSLAIWANFKMLTR